MTKRKLLSLSILVKIFVAAIILLGFKPDLCSYDFKAKLQWFSDGSKLIVNGKWIFNTVTHKFSRLRYETKDYDVAISPSGKSVLITDRERFRVCPLNGSLCKWIEIPLWIDLKNADGLDPEFDTHVASYWISEYVIYFSQTNINAGEQECRLYNLDSKKWSSPVGGCLAGDFFDILYLDSGLGDMVAIYSSAEGHLDVTIAKYNPSTGQSSIKMPERMICIFPYGYGSVWVTFSIDNSSIYLTTPCILERPCIFEKGNKLPCDDIDIDENLWRIYSWSASEGLKLEHGNLPKGAIMSPNGRDIAWLEHGKLCISSFKPEKKCYFTLPKE